MRRRRRHQVSGLLQHQHESLHAHGKTKSVGGRAFQDLRQTVISPATNQAILGAQDTTGDFESRAGVIIQTAHQPRNYCELDFPFLQVAQEFFKMSPTPIVQEFQDRRELIDDRLAGLDFAIQNAQGIGLTASLAVLTKQILLGGQFLL